MKDLKTVKKQLRRHFTSPDPIMRARAFLALRKAGFGDRDVRLIGRAYLSLVKE